MLFSSVDRRHQNQAGARHYELETLRGQKTFGRCTGCNRASNRQESRVGSVVTTRSRTFRRRRRAVCVRVCDRRKSISGAELMMVHRAAARSGLATTVASTGPTYGYVTQWLTTSIYLLLRLALLLLVYTLIISTTRLAHYWRRSVTNTVKIQPLRFPLIPLLSSSLLFPRSLLSHSPPPSGPLKSS